MKTKEQVNPNWKPAFYAMCYSDLRKVALEYWYALALHWSLQSDMDLIAVAWVQDAKPMDELIKALEDCIGKTMFRWNNEFTRKQKPHWRVCYCISIGADTYIDLSVVDVINPRNLEQEWFIISK